MAWPSVKWAKSGLQAGFKWAPRWSTRSITDFWHNVGVSVNGGTPNGLFIRIHLKKILWTWMIWGYPHFRTPPCTIICLWQLMYGKYRLYIYSYRRTLTVYVWTNCNNSLTWNKAILRWFLLLTMIPVRSQWGRFNFPNTVYIYMYISVYQSSQAIAGCIFWFEAGGYWWNLTYAVYFGMGWLILGSPLAKTIHRTERVVTWSENGSYRRIHRNQYVEPRQRSLSTHHP